VIGLKRSSSAGWFVSVAASILCDLRIHHRLGVERVRNVAGAEHAARLGIDLLWMSSVITPQQ
jgi:hypothetical protein